MADKVRMALIGCGQRGPGLGGTVQEVAETELVAVCDLDPERAQRVGAALDVPCLTDHQELLAREDVDGLVIATHTRHHAAVALDAAKAAKHFLVEKPFADSLSSGREVVAAAEASGIVGMIGFQLRFMKYAQEMKRLAEEIQVVQVNVTQQRGFFNPQYFFPEHYGGIMDGLSHEMDLALWWAGRAPTRVMANQCRGLFRPEKDAIEFANVLATCGRGECIVNMSGSMAGCEVQNIHQLVGLRGNASATDRQKIRYATHKGFQDDKTPIDLVSAETDCPSDWSQMQSDMVAHFARCILEGRADVSPGASLRDGLAQAAVSEAAAVSAQEGRTVETGI